MAITFCLAGGQLPRSRCRKATNSKAVGAARSLAALPYPHGGVAWAHDIGGCRTDNSERSSIGPAKRSIRPAQPCLKQRRIEFGCSLCASAAPTEWGQASILAQQVGQLSNVRGNASCLILRQHLGR